MKRQQRSADWDSTHDALPVRARSCSVQAEFVCWFVVLYASWFVVLYLASVSTIGGILRRDSSPRTASTSKAGRSTLPG